MLCSNKRYLHICIQLYPSSLWKVILSFDQSRRGGVWGKTCLEEVVFPFNWDFELMLCFLFLSLFFLHSPGHILPTLFFGAIYSTYSLACSKEVSANKNRPLQAKS